MTTEARIEELLLKINRKGLDELWRWYKEKGFTTSPASTKHHSIYPGGLADHSYRVYEKLHNFNEELKLGVPDDSVVLASIFHDVCKVGLYILDGERYKTNKAHPKGHGRLSVYIIKRFIELTELEEKMILYHMGPYGTVEFDERTGEYPLRGGGLANAWYHYPAVKVIYICDELATMEEKKKED